MKKLVFIPICFILLLGNVTKSQEVDTIYRLLYGHDYIDPDKKPYVDELLEVKWSVDINEQLYPPVVIDGIIFLYGNSEFAIDGITGKKLYFDSKIAQRHFRKVMKDSIIYNEKRFRAVCVNVYTGEKYHLRKSLTENIIFPVKDSLVFVFKDRENDILVGYNILTEETKWEYLYSPRFQFTNIVDDKLILGDGNYISCINVKNGNEIWKVEGVEFLSNLILHKNELYCITGSNELYVLNINTGKKMWSYSNVGGRAILFKNNNLFFTSTGLFALNMNQKEIIWKLEKEISTKNSGLINNYIIAYEGAPEYGEEMVVVNRMNGKVEYKGWSTNRFKLTSEEESQMDHESSITEHTLIFSKEWNNMIYATCTNDSLYCFQIKTPEKK